RRLVDLSRAGPADSNGSWKCAPPEEDNHLEWPRGGRDAMRGLLAGGLSLSVGLLVGGVRADEGPGRPASAPPLATLGRPLAAGTGSPATARGRGWKGPAPCSRATTASTSSSRP